MKSIQKGFTLIELMIVVAIIGILAAVAIPAYSNYTKKAKFTEVTQSTQAMKSALEACYADTNDLTLCRNGSNGVPLPIPSTATPIAVAAVAADYTTAGGATVNLGKYVNTVNVYPNSATSATIIAKAVTVAGLNGETYGLDGTVTANGFSWLVNTTSTCLTIASPICK